MKNILLVTDCFPPGMAPRMGYFCKWIKENTDWGVTVVHSEVERRGGDYSQMFHELVGFYDKEYVFRYEDGIHTTRPVENLKSLVNKRISLRSYIETEVSRISYKFLGRAINFSAKSVIDRALSVSRYDIILCSMTGTSVFMVAEYARRKAHCKVVYDIRDLAEQNMGEFDSLPKKVKKICRYRTEALRQASKIVVVVESIGSLLRKYDVGLSYDIVYNGYDPEIFYEVKPIKSSCFEVAYIGIYRPYATAESFGVFIEALESLLRDTRYKDCIRIVCYMEEHVFYRDMIPSVPENLKEVFCLKEPIPHREIAEKVFAQSPLLLFLGVSSTGAVDGISTRFFEYLSSGRPILNVCGDRKTRTEEIMVEAHAGCVARTPGEVKSFLIKEIEEWRNIGYTASTSKLEYVKRFSRSSESKELFDILKSICL